MKSTTKEWVNKAEGDYDTVCILRRSRKHSRFDPICFHCQQCVEKYLKARLDEAGVRIARTHDLGLLLNSLRSIEPLWVGMAKPIEQLTQYAVSFRYPDKSADSARANAAYATAVRLRELARASLGLR